MNTIYRNTSYYVVILLLCLAATTLNAQYGRLDVQDIEPNLLYRAVAAADSNHCIAVGSVANGLAIKRTSNGGKTWHTFLDTSWSYQALRNQPRSIAYPTPNLCIIVGDSGMIFRSSDAGENWQRIPSGIPYPLSHIAMCDSLHGIIPVATLDPLITTDGGLTWNRTPTPPPLPDSPGPYLISDVAYLTPNDIIYLRVRYPVFFTSRTSDGGQTWTNTPIDSVSRIYFKDATHGWGCGGGRTGYFDVASDIITRTTDGAASWETVLDKLQEPAFGLIDIAFADLQHGIAVENSKFLRTTDGGETWVDLARVWKLGTSGQDPFLRVAYPVPSKAWVVAPAIGAIYAYSGPAVSGVASEDEQRKEMLRAYPNPISGSGTIHYRLAKSTRVRLSIVDEQGCEVKVLADGMQAGGEYSMVYDASDLAAGMYFVRLAYAQNIVSTAVTVVR